MSIMMTPTRKLRTFRYKNNLCYFIEEHLYLSFAPEAESSRRFKHLFEIDNLPQKILQDPCRNVETLQYYSSTHVQYVLLHFQTR